MKQNLSNNTTKFNWYVIRLPIRNWNVVPPCVNKLSILFVIRLPIRNWNFRWRRWKDKGIRVIRLPIRNWNEEKLDKLGNEVEVIRLPIRNWNKLAIRKIIKASPGY